MTDKMISFRDFLKAKLKPVAEKLGHAVHNVDLISEIVLLLANYQEEGTNLFPLIFICRTEEHLREGLAAREMIAIGEGSLDRDTYMRAFKQCAPLAEDRLWAVYFIAGPDKIRYGIFRSDPSPLMPTVFERIAEIRSSRNCILGLTRLGGNFVEISASGGLHHFVNLSGTDEDGYHPGNVIHNFVDLISRDASPLIAPYLRFFYYRAGMDIMHGSHGCLVGIVDKGSKVPEVLRDGIHLQSTLAVADALTDIQNGRTDSDTYQRIRSYSLLLRKLTWMDGITLLNTQGDILGYNCFIRSAHFHPRDSIIGGARRRAYEDMRALVPEGLAGALYRSQDGQVEFAGRSY